MKKHFESLVERYRHKIIAVASRFTRVRDDAEDIAQLSSDPEAAYLERERAGLLSGAINKLTPGLRETIELHGLGEQSTEETAQRMGVSATVVKARLYHARKKLRGALSDQLKSPRLSGEFSANANCISRDHLVHAASI